MSKRSGGIIGCKDKTYFNFPSVASHQFLDRQKRLWFWCPCMEINVSVQYNGGLLPDIILFPDVVTLGNPFDTMKRFCLQPKVPT